MEIMERDTMMNFSISKYNFYSANFISDSIITKKQQRLVINEQWNNLLKILPSAVKLFDQKTIRKDIENYRFTKQFNDAMGFAKNNPGVFPNIDKYFDGKSQKKQNKNR